MRLTTAALIATAAVGCNAAPSEPSAPGGPGYPGAGRDYRPMPAGSIMHCFDGDDDPTPAATIEHVLEVFAGATAVHVRLTLDPRFVDNTYGVNAIGWPRGHTYKQLDGSDHAQLVLYDGTGAVALDFAMDYITRSITLGVSGGDGEVAHGDPGHILAVDTSLSQNYNARGYTGYPDDSPATDDAYTPNPAAPGWDYRVVYEAWIDLAAFGPAGFGSADVEYVHASPAKADGNTIIVDPYPCPPDWDPPGCDDPDGCPEGGCDRDDDCGSGSTCDDTGVCVPDIG